MASRTHALAVSLTCLRVLLTTFSSKMHSPPQSNEWMGTPWTWEFIGAIEMCGHILAEQVWGSRHQPTFCSFCGNADDRGKWEGVTGFRQFQQQQFQYGSPYPQFFNVIVLFSKRLISYFESLNHKVLKHAFKCLLFLPQEIVFWKIAFQHEWSTSLWNCFSFLSDFIFWKKGFYLHRDRH